MKYSLLVTILVVAAAASGSDAGWRAAQVHLLPRRGMQERAVCSAEGRCMNKVVKCPPECPEMNPGGGRQRKACAVDCADACAATCKANSSKEFIHTTMASNASSADHSWCNKTTYESLCMSMVQSNPRKDLKSGPQGLVVTLVNAAQAKANATRLFIEALQNHTIDDYAKSKVVFEGCLLAYNLDYKCCADPYDSLRTVTLEMTYDCEWDFPNPISPPLNQMCKNVESLASIIEAAQQILSLIRCGTS